MNKFILPALAGMVLAGAPAFAATAVTMTEADCKTAWEAADVNKDGVVTEDEAPRYFAFYRLNDTVLKDGKLDGPLFLKDCQAGVYAVADAESGAPIEGANSFTENQAKDRIVTHGGSDISALVKDDKGIWRGTATANGEKMNVAVDYKGNVVFTK